MRLMRTSAAVLVLASLSASAAVSLPKIFGDHMVLQRDQKIPVWGWAAPGEKVAVRIDDGPAVEATTAADGSWRVDLPALPAGGPHKLSVAGANTVAFEDVLVGEVWLCSGQSNMEWPMAASHEAKDDMAAANFPQIRHIGIPKATAGSPQKDVRADWKVCAPGTVGSFTAVGYFFGLELHRQLNVPIGLINSSWGGTRIEPWTTPDGFDVAPSLANLRKQIAESAPGSAAFRQKLTAHIAATETWLAKARAALDGGPLDAPPAFPNELKSQRENTDPCALYNAMIHPLVPYGVRGAIWYQGESNHGEGRLYTDKTRALVEGWRADWKQAAFPFYFVQIAPFQYGEEDPEVLPIFWEAQAEAAKTIPDTGMTVIHDIGNITDIHPRNKKEVGRRMALQALAKTYGRADTVWSGPVFQSLETRGAELRVKFDHAHGGLKTRDGKAPTHFEIIGPDTDYVPAQARIEGDTVVLTAANCPQPAAVRFGWHKTAEPNLCNGVGLPAVQFRAGTVPRVDTLSKVAEAKDYTLVYDLDLAKLGGSIAYDVNNAAAAPKFDRVAYFLELRKAGEPVRYAFVSMDAFTHDAAKLGIPTAASGAHFQQPVSNLNVTVDAPGLASATGIAGNIEFWPNNYGPANSAGVPGGDDAVYDLGDQPADPVEGYGCLQIHQTAAKQTLIAVNQWKSGSRADLGIGNSPGNTRDWTFTSNASSYTLKRLRVFVRPAR